MKNIFKKLIQGTLGMLCLVTGAVGYAQTGSVDLELAYEDGSYVVWMHVTDDVPLGAGNIIIGASQVSIVTPRVDGKDWNLSLLQGGTTTENPTGANGNWIANTKFDEDDTPAQSEDYFAFGTNGGHFVSGTDNTDGSKIKLFSFSTGRECENGIRLFNNDTDPNSTTLNGPDFKNAIATGIFGESAYVKNINPNGVVCDTGLQLVKDGAITSGTGSAGDTITYTFVVTNTSETTVSSLTLTDAKLEMASQALDPSTIAPGASATVTAVYTITQDDVNAGVVNNIASVSGVDGNGTTVSDTSSTSADPTGNVTTVVTLTKSPELQLVKSGVVSGTGTAGDTITYSFVLTNVGNTTVTDLSITDAMLTPSTIAIDGSLAPSESVSVTASYTIQQSDVNAGEVTNSATVEGQDPDGNSVVDTSSTTADPTGNTTTVITLTKSPELQLVKSGVASGSGAVGDTITYSFVLTNVGNTTVTDLSITDAKLTPSTIAIDGSLEPSESVSVTASYIITQSDVDAGEVTNSATVEGQDPDGNSVVDTSSTTADPTGSTTTVVPLTASPELQLIKSGVVSGSGAAGDTITYSFVLTNVGNTTVTDLSITDAMLTPSTIAIDGSLAPSESVSVTASYIITQSDVDAGEVTNSATVEGQDPDGNSVVDTSSTTADPTGSTTTVVPLTASPELQLVKSGVVSGSGAAGDTITYSFVLTNVGNTTVTDLSITDAKLTPSTIAIDGSLAPSESVSVTASYIITQSDVDAGEVTNSATVEGQDPDGNSVVDTSSTTADPTGSTTTVVPLTASPELQLVKSGVVSGSGAAGDTITYSFVLTNVGNTTVTDLSITDAKLTPSTIAIDGSLAPSESVSVTASYIITQSDIDAGEVTNSATVEGQDPDGNSVVDTSSTTADPTGSTTTVVPLTASPELQLVKSGVVSGSGAAGDTITYSFVLTNVGNTTVTDLSITDAKLTPSTIAIDGSLAPSESVSVTASYIITQSDVDAGEVTNSATVEGQDPDGNSVVDTSSTTADPTGNTPTVLPLTQNPELTLVKTGVESTVVNGASTITYTFLLSNSGNVAVTNMVITDEKLTPNTIAVAGTLAPGETRQVTAVYPVTQADVNAGQVTNTATVEGQDPAGNAVTATSTDNTNATGNTETVTPVRIVLEDDSGLIPFETASTISITDNDPRLPSEGSLSIIQQSSNGTATIDNNGTPNDPSDDLLVFTPNDGYSGTTEVVYQVCAANGTSCDTATVTLIVAEPTATPEDQDGVSTGVEDTGPSTDGDFNSDGIIDSQQTAVVTLLDCPVDAANCNADDTDLSDGGKDWVAITLLDANNQPLENCSAFRNTFTAQEGATGVYGPQDASSGGARTWSVGQDANYYYPFGLIGFSVECDDPNQVVSGIKTYFFGAGTDAAKAELGNGSYTVRQYADVGGPANGANVAFQNMSEIVTMSSGMEMVDFSVTGSRTVSTQREAFVITTTLADESAGDSSLGQVSGKYRIFNLHGPALPVANFTMSKTVNKSEANVGDLLAYTLKVENKSDRSGSFKVYDKLPAGLNLLGTDGKATRNPGGNLTVGSEDGYVSFTDNGGEFTLAANSEMTISYVVQVGPGAIKGEISNLAFTGSSPSNASSNVAKAVVTIMANDPIFDLSTVIGKVFNDLNENGSQDPGEHGLPGVRLATVSGEVILTDANGRYHIPAVESDIGGNGKNYILKLDEASLPSCARVISENPRVLRLTAGLMSRMDFAVNVGTTKPAKPAKPGEKRTLLDTIYFQNAKDEISIDQLQRLDAEISRYLQDPNVSVRISGHTDSDPLRSGKLKKQFGDNYGLSQNRARVVGEEIISKLNLPRDRIEFAGYGPDRPVASNKTEEGQARNRRTEIEIITYTKGESGASRGGSCSADTVGVVEIMRNAGIKSRAAIAKPVVKSEITPVRIVLNDSFFSGTSTIPKNLDNVSKIAHALQNGGGELHIISTDQDLASRRAAILNSMLSDTLGNTAMSRIQIRSSAQ